MSETKQSAVEWYATHNNMLNTKLVNNEISITEFIKQQKELVLQAKKIEQENELHFYANGQADTIKMFSERLNRIQDIPRDFNKILNENFWNLI